MAKRTKVLRRTAGRQDCSHFGDPGIDVASQVGRAVFCSARLVERGGGAVTNRLPHHTLVSSSPLASTARVLQVGNTSRPSSGRGWPPQVSCFSPCPSRLRTKLFLAMVVWIVSEPSFSSPSELHTSDFSPPSWGWKEAPPVGPLHRSQVVLGCNLIVRDERKFFLVHKTQGGFEQVRFYTL